MRDIEVIKVVSKGEQLSSISIKNQNNSAVDLNTKKQEFRLKASFLAVLFRKILWWREEKNIMKAKKRQIFGCIDVVQLIEAMRQVKNTQHCSAFRPIRD